MYRVIVKSSRWRVLVGRRLGVLGTCDGKLWITSASGSIALLARPDDRGEFDRGEFDQDGEVGPVAAVFSHGRLRLYLLKLLDDGPKHGYELIRLLENRFHGMYAPSAGTIYPRLQRMEAEGLVAHTASGGRKVYEITGAGRAELGQRSAELAALETDIRASVADLAGLAGEIRSGVLGSVRDLKRELREAARETRRSGWQPPAGAGSTPQPRPNGPTDLAAEFDERLAAFVAEVRGRVRGMRPSETQLRTAIRILDGALDGLRRLLR